MGGAEVRPIDSRPTQPWAYGAEPVKIPPYHRWRRTPTELNQFITNRYLWSGVSNYEGFLAWLARRSGVIATKIRTQTNYGLMPNQSSAIEAVYLRKPSPSDANHQRMIAEALKSVVMVNGWDAKGMGWSGSGVILDPKEVFPDEVFPEGTYFVLTNNHVTPKDETKFISITMPDQRVVNNVRVLPSKINGAPVQDSNVDASLLLIQSPFPLPTIHIAKNPPKAGDVVFAFGHPLGLPKAAVTRGIVSQPAAESGAPIFTIQHDAEINPGNSGGPLLNEDGELIGLNTFTFKGSKGLSFAMPIWDQLTVINAIYKNGEYVRGDFGLTIDEFTQFERVQSGFPQGMPGAKVTWVDYGSPAEQAGIKPNDIITLIATNDGRMLDIDIDNSFEVTRFLKWMHETKPGMPVHINVMRPQKVGNSTIYTMMSFTLITAKLEPVKTAIKSDDFGMLIQRDNQGRFVITHIDSGSPAEAAGIPPRQMMLDAIEVKELSDEPIAIRDLDDLKNIFITIREAGVTNIVLYVSPLDRPREIRKIQLTRNDSQNISASTPFAAGIREMFDGLPNAPSF